MGRRQTINRTINRMQVKIGASVPSEVSSQVLAHRGLTDCWDFLTNIAGSLPYNMKYLEANVVVICRVINKTELIELN